LVHEDDVFYWFELFILISWSHSAPRSNFQSPFNNRYCVWRCHNQTLSFLETASISFFSCKNLYSELRHKKIWEKNFSFSNWICQKVLFKVHL